MDICRADIFRRIHSGTLYKKVELLPELLICHNSGRGRGFDNFLSFAIYNENIYLLYLLLR
jgi:hypothetical protein